MIKYSPKTKNELITNICLNHYSHVMYEVLLILTDNGVLGNDSEMNWLATNLLIEIDCMYTRLGGRKLPFQELNITFEEILAKHKLN